MFQCIYEDLDLWRDTYIAFVKLVSIATMIIVPLAVRVTKLQFIFTCLVIGYTRSYLCTFLRTKLSIDLRKEGQNYFKDQGPNK